MILKNFTVDFAGSEYPCFFISDKATANSLIAKLKAKPGIIAADTETAALPQYKHIAMAALYPQLANIRLLQLFTGTGAAVIDLHATGPIDLKSLFETRPSVFHNMTFDYKMLRQHYNVVEADMHCTCIMARCVFHAIYPDKKSASLKDVAATLFGHELNKKAGSSDWSIPELTFEQVKYAALDAIVQMKIYEKLNDYIDKLKLRNVYNLYRKAQIAICEMELNGVSFDKKQHMENVVKWRNEQLDSLDEVLELTGLDEITDAKLGKWLEKKLDQDTLQLWPRTETGKLKTDAHTFVDFSHLEIVKPFSRYQKLKKLTTAFGTKLIDMCNPATGKLHPTYTVAGAKTGRLSCSNPNLQQSPRGDEMRSVFVASPGYEMVVADYSQVEVRCIAEFSNDANMLTAYQEGLDIYAYTASRLNGKPLEEVTKPERQAAKACFSGDTEVLTRQGWVRLDQYNDQEVAQYSLPCGVDYNQVRGRTCRFSFGRAVPEFTGVGGEISFVQPLGYIEKPGIITEYKDRRNSLAITDDHQIIYVNNYNEVFKKPWKDCGDIRHFINAGWLKSSPIICDQTTRLIAAIIADGHFETDTVVRFGFSKRRKYRRLVEIILPGMAEFTHSRSGSAYKVRVKLHPGLATIVHKYVSKSKVLSWSALTDFPREVFLEEAQYWDGHVNKRGNYISFSTVVRQTVEVMQAMAHCSGMLFNFKESHSKNDKHRNLFSAIYAVHNHQPLSRPHLKKGPTYETTVYCLEVPSGALVIRHNNKVSIQGNCVLGLNYGLGASKFSHYAKKGYGVDISDDASATIIKAYRDLYSDLRQWQLSQVDLCAANKYTSYTVLGKSRKMTEDDHYGASMNHPVQGSCAEIMLLALVYIRQMIKGTSARLLATVHDEVMLECKPEDTEKVKALVKEAMEKAYLKILPSGRTIKGLVDPSSGANWAEAK